LLASAGDGRCPSSRLAAGGKVSFCEWRDGGWFCPKSVATGVNGWTRYVLIHAPARRGFYARASQAQTLWGALAPD
jgi:hypothetical protein